MVPLEQVTKRRPATEPVFVPRKVDKAPVQEEPKPRAPRRFRIVDVMTRQVLADDVATRAAVDVLRDVRSVVDVNVYVWQDAPGRWSLLSLGEQRTMLELAREAAAAAA